MDPVDMDYHDLVEVVRSIHRTLWPDGGDVAWSPDTIDAVAGILTDAGLGPEKRTS